MSGIRDLSDLAAGAAAECPDRFAIVEAGGRCLTWRALEDEVGRIATGLGRLGVLGGHRVLLAVGNRLEFVATYLAVLRAQAVAVPVNPDSTVDELARMLADSGARLAIADATAAAGVREAIQRLGGPPRLAVVGERSYDELRASAARPVPRLPDPDKLAVLLYTAGNSGPARAAMLTHRALVANIEQCAQVEPAMVHGDDVVLGLLPLFHSYGLNAVLGNVLRHRAKLVLVERFDPQETLAIIDDEACSVVPVAPPVLTHWLSEPDLRERLGSVRLLISGSAPLSAATVLEFADRAGVPVHQGYGLTEAAPVVTSTLRSADHHPGSVGAALPGIEIRVVDEDGGPAERGDPGEIWIRGANLFSGYWPDGSDGPDDEGWWPTGDIGLLDDHGDLFLVDRVTDLVVVSGFNVYPAEVEEVIEAVPGVAEAAVIGVADERTGAAVVAYVRAPDRPAVSVLAAVRAHCAERLARFKQPARIEVVAELPRTSAGTVHKGRLRGIERRRTLGPLE